MNTQSDFKKRAIEILLSALVTAVLVIAAGYGYTVTVLEPLVAEAQAEARGGGVTRFTSDVQMMGNLSVDHNTTVSGNLVAANLFAASNTFTSSTASNFTATTLTATTSALTNATITSGTVTNLAATNITATTAISLSGANFSGPLRYGAASSIVSGTTVAHGFAMTPTMFIAQNATLQATTFTQTVYGFGCNVTSCTLGITEGVITTTNVTWVSGK